MDRSSFPEPFIISSWMRSIARLLLFAFLFSQLFAAGTTHAATAPLTDANLLQQRYRAAKDFYYTLERKSAKQAPRQDWLAGIRKFRRIYQVDNRGPLAPSCLFMIGRMYRRMYQRFRLPIDLDEALLAFSRVAELFPGNRLADDALFLMGNIYEKEKQEPQQAVNTYIRLVQEFPSGDRYVEAINRIHRLSESRDVELPEKLRRSSILHTLVKVLPVKFWSSRDYTRVAITTSAPVHYSARLLEKDGNNPRRLYIDLDQSFIPPANRTPVPIRDGLLRQVRSGQFNDSTVRVVLDIESISDYKIFTMNDPFRIIIDVHGVKRKQEQGQKSVTAASPPAKKLPHINEPAKEKGIVILRPERKKIVKAKQPRRSLSPSRELSLAQQLGLGIRKIILDPGHGGKDPGAMAFGLKEKDIVLEVGRYLKKILEQEHGYEVQLTRNSDRFLPLEERTALANTAAGDLFVSIHVNAHPDSKIGGVETFFLNLATNTEAMRVAARENATSTHNISEMQDILRDLMQNAKIQESSRLAEFVQNSLAEQVGHTYKLKNLGVKQAPFYVLIGAEMPAVLAEISFITNSYEANLLRQPSYLKEIARSIADGIDRYAEHHAMAAFEQ